MIGGNHLLQFARIAVFAQSGMQDQLCIPNAMQIAGIFATPGCAKHRNRNVISPPRVCHCMERLAQVADKVHQNLSASLRAANGCFGSPRIRAN